ncbi:inositol phosphorylceramide synthase [Streptomyces cyaneochromogenes]|uniref:Inositol phosphorylceramide synthase n=1 Tax=Streptomyces cyaneochromogenes TaxID=2496836 RepID=A0A3S9M516_9ACTN|nr:phosphatase PAP2 family protein [Streptomyces cyaneochromogenes]AZQ34301.1 inositol phosphorylceramide synthase [Streptomyces cyaneochromogenes]
MGETTVTTLEGREPAVPHPVTAETRPGPLRRLRTPRRPRLWFEILLIAVSYWTYSLIRNAVPEQKAEALRNADWLWELEHHLGIAVEESINHTVDSVTWLIVGMNYYYATLHFIVTLAVLVWLYRSHPGRYAATRLVLFATTGVALVGYYLYPLAPPRLMTNGGFIDTVLVHDTWGSMASGDLKNMSNQYAAMPSMHIGWSVWSGVTIFALARVPWVRVLGLLYPTATLVVIVATANHFWLDAVGGLLCLAFGYTVARLWYGALPHALPRQPRTKPHPRTAGRGRAGERPPAAARVSADQAPHEPIRPTEDGHPPAQARPTTHA